MACKTLSLFLGVTAGVLAGPDALAQNPVTLAERFDPSTAYRVELKVRLAGRLAVPQEPGKPPQVLPMSGESTVTYDERVLPADEPQTARTVRAYREVQFARTAGGKDQKAEVRPSVRRMVVLRSDRGKKAPFSPDGPLTWGEIDVVRTDVFSPALVPGLLPPKPVRPGDRWRLTPAAVVELTDLDPIDSGELMAEFVSVVTISNKRYAKLGVSGSVRGGTEDGTSQQKFEGSGYFDLEAHRLTYLNLKGTREMFGPDGKTVSGRIDGTFVMTRGPAEKTADISEEALRGVDLRPTAANTELLYDNPDLGVRFHHPRRWRVGTVQGQQVTLDEPGGGGVLITVEPASRLPGADKYLAEVRDFLTKQGAAITGADAPRRVSDRPRLDRFALEAEVKKEKVRLEYAVVSQPEGGVTVSARLPWADRDELGRDVERVLRTLSITKRIEK
ncbi:MAG TPA: hypothetical protein VM533_08285 [Fimbriiglobus sp.]|nr:hypothetical protein [Fimbriiglobus sp.]